MTLRRTAHRLAVLSRSAESLAWHSRTSAGAPGLITQYVDASPASTTPRGSLLPFGFCAPYVITPR